MVCRRSRISIWIQALRAPFFTASLVPVLLGAALAYEHKLPVSWKLLPAAVLCTLLLHAATNMLNDFYDYRNGVDKKYTFGSSRVITDGLLSPETIRKASCLCFTAGSLLALLLIARHWMLLLPIAAAGIAGGYLYSAGPRGLKYIGLGDILVFFLMGPLLTLASYLVLTTKTHAHVLPVCLPVGFLVVAILHANNLRDLTHDKHAGVTTLAARLGFKASQRFYLVLLAASYISVGVMAAVNILPPASLIVLITLPRAYRNTSSLLKASAQNTQALAALDVQT
ncbi:MAG: 1,4-dihydroxy-2-naphthoate octaprenyltransferase, partial [Candidatus Omnitrophica bacterium]|nr:1,4-dihydroxy-2-naphthoate octaprenyltransferase [Candidatus Omnitrophota bacterium]